MSGIDWVVIIGGFGLIGMIAYYFFGPKEGEVAMKEEGKQKVNILVEGAYDPSTVEVKVNVPVEVIFDRRDKGECTEWVVFDDLPTEENKEIKMRLPEGKKTAVSFTPTRPGTYDFACGMGMVHGKLVVKE